MRSILYVIFLLFSQFAGFGQYNNCNSYILSDKKVLWTYNNDSDKKLYYTISLCKHNGAHPSKIEITKSDDNDTSEIRGVLKTDIGYFDIKGIDSTVASYNYQNGSAIIANEKNEKQSISMVWEKWFGLMNFNIYAKSFPEITFEGKCVDDEDSKKGWSKEMVLWKCKSDNKINLMYRVKIGEGGLNSTIEITSPVKMDSVEIFGTLKVKEIHRDGGVSATTTKIEKMEIKHALYSKQYTFDFNNINQISFEGDCLDLKKLFKSKIIIIKDTINQPIKIKTKIAVIGDRG